MTNVDSMMPCALEYWRARHHVVRKGPHTWKVHVALEDGYLGKSLQGKVRKCERVVMGWIDFAAARPPEMGSCVSAGFVVPCCRDCVAVLWARALAYRADRLEPTYRPCCFASFPSRYYQPLLVCSTVVPRCGGVRGDLEPGERVVLSVRCCAEHVGHNACSSDCA